MKTLILISGFKRSGKDTSADYIVSKLPKAVKRSFAGPLKQIIADTLGITIEQLEDLKNTGATFKYGEDEMSFRLLLQRFGTEAMKGVFGDKIWAHLLIDSVKDGEITVVSDWRFVEEYSALKDEFNKVYTIRIHSGDIIEDTHSSEIGLLLFPTTYSIENSKKDETLFTQIDKIIKDINENS
jgi:hypothetical protein